jgi:hypothetical protein
MPKHSRKSEISRRRARRQKVRKLRKRYTAARTDGERAHLLSKLGRVAPSLPVQRFIESASPATKAGA